MARILAMSKASSNFMTSFTCSDVFRVQGESAEVGQCLRYVRGGGITVWGSELEGIDSEA